MKKVSKQMRKVESIEKPAITRGLDIGDRYGRFCLVNRQGDIVEEGRMQNTEPAIQRRFAAALCMRSAIE
jgi:transposase